MAKNGTMELAVELFAHPDPTSNCASTALPFPKRRV